MQDIVQGTSTAAASSDDGPCTRADDGGSHANAADDVAVVHRAAAACPCPPQRLRLDAGTAVDVARSIDLDTITVPERKASLLIDTARAFLRWDKPDKAYLALRAAEQTAHEEVAGRPSVHRVVRQLVTAAMPTLRRDAEQFAAHIGAAP